MAAASSANGHHRNQFIGLMALYLVALTTLSTPLSGLLIFALWLVTGGANWCKLAKRALPRDLRLLSRGLKLIFRMIYVKTKDVTIVAAFRETVAKYPNRVMYVNASTSTEWTYSKMETYSNRVANYFLGRGFAKGDTVALFMENRPEYVGLWLGLAKIGVVPALINYNLQRDPLLHTITVAQCRAIIYGLELEKAVEDVKESLRKTEPRFELFHSKSGSDQKGLVSQVSTSVDLDEAIQAESNPAAEPKSVRDSLHCNDNLLYIYTSGTTGLPKAVIIKHVRQLFAMYASHYIIGLSSDDVVYCHLPLYHSSGGQVATCSSLLFGTKTVIRRKFSASAFWKDCVKHKITATQYIGEICRYLLASKEVPEERQHNVRIMFGNGLRPQIWSKFVQRFNIPNIAEFYGSTEGNSNICNIENKVGAVGFVGILFPDFIVDRLLPLKLIKVDKATGEPLRNAEGFCIACQPHEEGEFIGKIVRGDPVKDFQGYRDPEATRKKVLHDVFRKGDLYFRSGDILVMDDLGWLYFKDRSGDTFRWRGENVSTAEVEATASNLLDLQDACAYGVEIPGTEGKAGMIAIHDPDNELDLKKFLRGVSERLPSYARPIFVRRVQQLDLTGTYKLKKRTLQAEGFNVTLVQDPIFFLDTKLGEYVPLTLELYDDIIKGLVRL